MTSAYYNLFFNYEIFYTVSEAKISSYAEFTIQRERDIVYGHGNV